MGGMDVVHHYCGNHHEGGHGFSHVPGADFEPGCGSYHYVDHEAGHGAGHDIEREADHRIGELGLEGRYDSDWASLVENGGAPGGAQ